MWFFSQNIQRLEKQYGPWNPKWTGLPEIIPYEGDYFNFTMSFSRTWSYNGQTGTETVFPTNIIVKSDPDSMILQIDYDPSKGAGILTVHEHKETGVKNATIEAIYDSGDIHLSNMFSITQEPEPWNVHVIMIKRKRLLGKELSNKDFHFFMVEPLSLRINGDFFLVTAQTFVTHDAFSCGKQCIIPTPTDIQSRMDLGSALTIDDGTGFGELTIGLFGT